MRPELRKKIVDYNKKVAADRDAAEDFATLLSALPPGQRKQLLKDKVCAAILNKYGITE